jgi:5-formyltetrahydrofolate cyclo-ligase
VPEPQTPRPRGTPGGEPAGTTPPQAARKIALRDQLVTTRRRRTLLEAGAAARALAGHLLDTPEVRRAATVAAYVSMPGEPGTGVLLDALLAAGRRVILPVLLPDDDLDWAEHRGDPSLRAARRGLLEPDGPALGVDAVATADVVLVPGLAVSPDGLRLGRGGGSYDRALGRVPVGTFTCVLLFDDEVGLDVPAEPHDRRVLAAATPGGIIRLRRG